MMKTEIRFETCASCDATLEQGQTHCGCGRPTSRASFADRSAYEVLQWRAYKDRVEASN